MRVYDGARQDLEQQGVMNEEQKDQLMKALQVVDAVPTVEELEEDSWWRFCWNWNLT